MKKITILLPLILALLSPYCFAEDNLSTDEKAAVIAGIKRVISSEYVFVDKIDALNNAVDELYRSGKYDDIVEVKAFAQALTDDLVAYTKDKHLKGF